MRLFYSCLWYLLLPFLFVRLWWRGRLAPAYRQRWSERLALGYARAGMPVLEKSVWVHAVSVGEFLAAVPLIEALLQRHPDLPLVVTTTTPTGSERVQKTFDSRVRHVYCPWELPAALARFLNHFNPRLCLVMETELWPNLAHAASAHGCRLMLVNGRLSARSARGYAKFPALVRPLLAHFSCLSVQTENDARHFRELGATDAQLRVNGSIKFDLAIGEALREKARHEKEKLGARPVWIAASTHPQEEALVLAAHRQVLQTVPDALLIWVPRHPERFNAVATQVADAKLLLARRSRDDKVTPATQVYLADTMGELLMLYGVSDVALVAGSLAAPLGGHNLLEPAAWKLPVISGTHLENFLVIAGLLEQAKGLTRVHSDADLARAVTQFLQDAEQRKAQGEAAFSVLAANQGALARTLEQVEELL